MTPVYGTCDGCGRNDSRVLFYLMDDGAVWPLCPRCATIAQADGAAVAAVVPVAADPPWDTIVPL